MKLIDEGLVSRIGNLKNDLSSSIGGIIELLSIEAKQGKNIAQRNHSFIGRTASQSANGSGGQSISRKMSLVTEITESSRRGSTISRSSSKAVSR